MQVNLARPNSASRPGSSSGEPWADVLQALEPGPQARARHDEQLEQADQRIRRRELQRHDLLVEAASVPRPSQLMARAERDMAPGSHAAREQQFRAQLQKHLDPPQGEAKPPTTGATGRGDAVPPGRAAPTEEASAATPEQHTAEPGSAKPVEVKSEPPASPMVAGRPTDSSNPAQTTSPRPPSPAATTSLLPAETCAGVLPASSRGVLLTILATSPKAAAPAVRPTNATTPVVACGRVAGTLAKSSARPAVAAEPEPRSSDANVERILRFVRAQIGKDRAVATLRLDPPELGTIRLRMDLRNEQLALDVQTQTVAARRLLSKHVETLRRDLEASGIHLGRVEIHAAPRIDARETATPQSGDWSAPDGSQSQSDPQTAGGGQSGELESPRAGPSELEGEPAFPGSVTESLVNILA